MPGVTETKIPVERGGLVKTESLSGTQYRAIKYRKGKVVSRYYATERGARAWLKKP